jgi:hypothetical protein
MMDLKEQWTRAVGALKGVADSDKVRTATAKAKETASHLARQVRDGAVSAADAFVKANSDAAALRVRYMNADLSIVSPSDDLRVGRPSAGVLTITDGAGNGLVINAAADAVVVSQVLGTVKTIGGTSFDIGPEDGANVVVLKG